jgi:hypothetical protein
MDLIHKYRKSAYNRNFECSYMWLDLQNDRSKIISFLTESQKNNSTKYRFNISDIDNVFKDKDFSAIDDGYISKVVLQKANFDVKSTTKDNGCTTRLLFLVKDSTSNGSWFLYGFAKGRYNDWSNFDIDESGMLGYTFYISLSEKDESWSSKISDNSSLERLRALLKDRVQASYKSLKQDK